jgi:hypothetical protein
MQVEGVDLLLGGSTKSRLLYSQVVGILDEGLVGRVVWDIRETQLQGLMTMPD